MIRKLLYVPFLLGVLTLTAFAQSKPDFSGTWKLNLEKSDFGELPPPTNRTDVITHKEPALSDSVTTETAEGKQSYTATYTTDGKESQNKIGPRDVRTTLKWSGNNLAMNAKFKFEDADVVGDSTWTLSADGKTLTWNIHYASSIGEIDQKMVFDKQEATAPKATP
jgi:hypothetical protein